jgi:hypothetical protein
MTGLPEYRNGGLFLDSGVIALKDSADRAKAHEVSSPLVVEWRALTVALLDEVGALIRQRLGRSRDELPLAKVLEGGSWAAGRRIAREKRVDGGHHADHRQRWHGILSVELAFRARVAR